MSNLPPAFDIDVEELEELNNQELTFVQGILAGKTQADAFRESRDCSAWSNNAIWVEASRLAAKPKVRLWLTHFRRQALARGAVTLDGHLAELDRLKELAIGTGNYGAAVKAEELRGKAAGVYLGDESGKLAKVPAAQLIDMVRGMIGDEAAQTLASKLGVTLMPKRSPMIDITPDTAHGGRTDTKSDQGRQDAYAVGLTDEAESA